MELRPVSPATAKWLERLLGWPLLVITAPVWGALIGFVLLERLWTRTFDPPRWRKVFALWPVECDAWPDEGFAGWVWLETVWRNPSAPGWTPYRREAPPLGDGEAIGPSSATGNSGTNQ